MRRPVAATITAVLALATFGIAGPASAATKTIRDPSGDAVVRYDLTRASVTNSSDRFTVLTHVKDLRGSGTQIFAVGLGEGRWSYTLTTVRRPNGNASAEITGYSGSGSIDINCDIQRAWKPAKDTIEISFPRDCIPSGRVGVALYIGAGDGTSGDPADWTDSVAIGQD